MPLLSLLSKAYLDLDGLYPCIFLKAQTSCFVGGLKENGEAPIPVLEGDQKNLGKPRNDAPLVVLCNTCPIIFMGFEPVYAVAARDVKFCAWC